MRKAFILIVVLALALGISYLVLHKSILTIVKQMKKMLRLTISSKSSAFNRSITSVLNSYYQLCDGFLGWILSLISRRCHKI